MKRTNCVRLMGLALGTALLLPFASTATVYDPALAFSPSNNPAGLWSYGFSTTLGGQVVLDPEQASDNGISVWRTNIWLGAPAVFHNGTGSAITNSTGTLVMPPGALALHPGPGGQYSVLRFSAPAGGSYQLAAAFSGFDTHGTTTDVHILTNGISVFDALVNGYGPGSGSSYSGIVALNSGDTLDFAVGWGANQEFSFDSTGLSAQITPVAAAPPCQPPPAGLVSWWPANGNAYDVIGTNHGTLVGNVGYNPGEVNQAFSFDGAGYVEVATSPNLNPSASFSLECWVYPPQDAPSQEVLIGKWGDNGELYNQRSYALALLPGQLVEFSISDLAHQTDHTFQILDSPNNAIILGAWNHLVTVYDQSTGTRRLYVNGTEVAERTDSPTTILSSVAPFTIGAWYRGGGWVQSYFSGQLDEVSFYNQALTATQVQGLYLAGSSGKCFVPNPGCQPPVSGMVSWWRAEGNALDSADANHGTLAGNVSYGPGQVGQAFVFDGANDGIQLSNPVNLQLQVFTIEAWIKRASTTVVSLDPGGNAAGTLYAYGDGGYGFQIATNGHLALGKMSYSAVLSGAPGVTDTNWHHVAVTKNGGTVTFYLDGAFNAQVSYDPGFVLNSPVTIGSWGPSLGNCFLGSIDELAVYNRALGTNEIHAIYAADGSGKCPSRVPPTITTQPASQVATIGSSVSFSVAASGSQPLTYQWLLNGANLGGKTASSLTVSNVQLSSAGSYSVIVSNLAGFMTSSNAVLTVPQPACDPPPAGLVSWWRAEGNALDSAGTNHGTPSSTIGYSNGEVGRAFSFDGLSSYVAVPASASLDVGKDTGFTIEGWIKPTGDIGADWAPIFEWNDGAGDAGGLLWLSQPTAYLGNGPGCLFINLIDTAGTYHTLCTAGGLVNTNGFQHVAVTYDKGTGVATVYYNGAVAVSQTLGSFTVQTGYSLYWGKRISGVTQSVYRGLMDEMSLYGRALSTSELQAIYSAGAGGKCFTPVAPSITTQPASQSASVGSTVTFSVTAAGTQPLAYQWFLGSQTLSGQTGTLLTLTNVQYTNAGTYSVLVTNLAGSIASSNAVLTVNPLTCTPPPAGLVSWWRAEGNAFDSAGTNNGTPSSTIAYGNGEVGGAFSFDGLSSYVAVPASASLDVGKGTGFTIEGWIKPTGDIGADWAPLFEWNDGAGNSGGHLWLSQPTADLGNGPGCLFINLIDTAGTYHTLCTAGGLVNTNGFQHVAVTYDKGTGIATIYCNGAVAVSQTLGSFTVQTGYSLYWGKRISGLSPAVYRGLMDEMSLYNRALLAGEIHSLYNAGGAGKCINNLPTAANLSAATRQNQPISIATDKLVLLASDPAGHPLSVSGVSPASTNGGGVVLAPGAVTYTPPANYIGPDRFTYTVSDGLGGNASAYVLLTVQPANLPSGNMLPPAPVPGGYQVGFFGLPGYAYSVQRATNISGPWLTIGTITTDSTGLGSFTDTNAPPAGAFYRTTYP